MFQSRIVELEQYILGVALSRSGEIGVMAKTLTPAHFTVEAHQYIFTSMIELMEKGDTTDLLSVSSKLRDMGRFPGISPEYLVTLHDVAVGEIDASPPEGMQRNCIMRFTEIEIHALQSVLKSVIEDYPQMPAETKELLECINDEFIMQYWAERDIDAE